MFQNILIVLVGHQDTNNELFLHFSGSSEKHIGLIKRIWNKNFGHHFFYANLSILLYAAVIKVISEPPLSSLKHKLSDCTCTKTLLLLSVARVVLNYHLLIWLDARTYVWWAHCIQINRESCWVMFGCHISHSFF